MGAITIWESCAPVYLVAVVIGQPPCEEIQEETQPDAFLLKTNGWLFRLVPRSCIVAPSVNNHIGIQSLNMIIDIIWIALKITKSSIKINNKLVLSYGFFAKITLVALSKLAGKWLLIFELDNTRRYHAVQHMRDWEYYYHY